MTIQVISWLLATGIGAGFAVSIEFKRFYDIIFDDAGVSKDDPTRSTNNKYFVRGIIASGVLSVAFIAMVVVSIISSINRSKSKGIFGWWYYFLSIEVTQRIKPCEMIVFIFLFFIDNSLHLPMCLTLLVFNCIV